MRHLITFNLFEGRTFDIVKKPFDKQPWDEDRKEGFRKKIKDHLKSQRCKTKQVGNDFEVYYGDEYIAQINFRDDYVGIKKEGNKFAKEFKYSELGKIKSELSDIVKYFDNNLE